MPRLDLQPLVLVTLDQERVKQVLERMGVQTPVIDIFLELHDTTRNMEKLLNEMRTEQGKMIEALQVVGKGFGVYAERLQKMEKKFGGGSLEGVTVHSEEAH